jgi:hypothetical protein
VRVRTYAPRVAAALAFSVLALVAEPALAHPPPASIGGGDYFGYDPDAYYDVTRPSFQNTNAGWRLQSGERDHDTGSWVERWCRVTTVRWEATDDVDVDMEWHEVECFRGEFSWQGGPLERSTYILPAWQPMWMVAHK